MGVFHGEGQENENGEKSTEDATGVAGYTSLFVEKTLGDRLAIGVDYNPSAMSSETANNDRLDKTTAASASSVTNSVKVDFEDLTSVYLRLNVSENIYLKAGMVSVDVITKEQLGTGSTYGDTDMSGETFGIGYNTEFGNGMFARIEGTYMDLGSVSVTASNGDNKVSINSLEGVTAKIAVGKSF
tara:strand:- start:54 stop:608 length:555 start_codon:yes stop_codon:yes gene_type:complete